MSVKQHTPGPWVIQDDGPGIVIASVETALGSITIRSIHSHPLPLPSKEDLDAEGLANARLIAAAPEMLEAAINILSTVEGFGLCEKHVPVRVDAEKLRASIAKAEGRDA